jgi:cytoskeletal protein CcmA (bactofilin family)
MADKREGDGTLSLISANTVVEGKMTTEGSVRIDGKLIGDVIAKANAAVGLTGTVDGSVRAKNVAVAGKLKGSVAALEKLILENRSVVKGDIRAARLVVDEGATFDGHCTMAKTDADQGRPGGHS